MELFEVIRLGYAAGETIQGLSRKHDVHQRMVRREICNAIPLERKAVVREAPRLGPVKELISDSWPWIFRRRASGSILLNTSGCAYAGRRDTGESFEEFLTGLTKPSDIATPTREQLAPRP